MATPTLITGDLWSAGLSNASIRPTLETDVTAGNDDPGSIAQVVDANLDPAPQYIRSRFYGWRDRMQLSAVPGSLTLSYTGAPVMKPNSTAIGVINPGSVVLPNNQVSFVFIQWTGASPTVAYSTQLPYEGVPLAVVTTAAGDITQLFDLRYQAVEQIRPISNPPQEQEFSTGDFKPTSATIAPPGWLLAQGQLVSKLDYPALFAMFNYSLGGSGNNFRIPDLRGKSLVGSGTGYPLWGSGGSATKQLSISELVPHSHGVNDTGHVHVVNDTGHVHVVNDNGHSHGVADPGHGHGVADPGHNHRMLNHRGASLNGDTDDDIGAEISTQGEGAYPPTTESRTNIQIQTQGTGIGIQGALANIGVAPSRANLTLAAAQSNISINSQGGGAAFSMHSPYFVCNYLIKT